MLRGKRRDFAVGLLLCIVTGGIYQWYWHYAAFKELYEQEGRDDFPLGLFIGCMIPLVNLVCIPLYISQQLDVVNGLRARIGLPPTIGFLEMLLWNTFGHLILIGPCIAYAKLQSGINDLWDSYTRGQGVLPADAASAAASFAAE